MTLFKQVQSEANGKLRVAISRLQSSYHADLGNNLGSWKIPVFEWGWLFDDPATLTKCKVKSIHNGKIKAIFKSDEGAVIPNHSHPSKEMLVVKSGVLLLVVDGVKKRLSRGDRITIEPGVEHSGRSLTSAEVEGIYEFAS